MKISKIYKQLILSLMAIFTISSCDTDTASLGIFPEADEIVNSSDIFNVYTQSLKVDSIKANSYTSYLGSVLDPETGAQITASFATQYYTFENYALPNRARFFPLDTTLAVQPDHSQDSIHCDSIELRLYFDEYYGEGGNPMKLEVYPLDINNVLNEDSAYYSNIDLSKFIVPGTKPIATKMFSPEDYSITDAERTSSTHSDNIRITLPKSYGDHMLQLYYDHPEYYKNSYNFIRNVCPGFYFRIKSGSGTMLGVTVGTMNLYFKYFDAECADSVYESIARFAATPEVIQSTKIENDDLQELVDNDDCTYLKTPAGIYTQVTLPVDEIYQEHQADSVNKAALTITRYNKDQNEFSLGTPSELLLVRKQNMYSFFDNHEVSDSQTSYTTTFDETYNTYTFDNICRLISYCQHEKIYGMKAEGLSQAQWEAKHPDWNKVVLIPVKTSDNTSGYQVSVTHDMGLNSIRLVGGPKNPIQMQVIYSQFAK